MDSPSRRDSFEVVSNDNKNEVSSNFEALLQLQELIKKKLEEELEKKRIEEEKRAIEAAKKAEREQKDKERRQQLRQWKQDQQKKNKQQEVNVEIMAPTSPHPLPPQRAVSFSNSTKLASPRTPQNVPKQEESFVVESITPKSRKAALIRYNLPPYSVTHKQ